MKRSVESVIPPGLAPFPVGHFRFTHTNFSSACCACEKGGGGRGKIAEIAERAAHFGRQSVKEEGAVACHEQPRIAIPP